MQAVTEDYARQSKGWGVSHLYADLGLYCQQVEGYLSVFSPDNVYVEFFETFIKDPVPSSSPFSDFSAWTPIPRET